MQKLAVVLIGSVILGMGSWLSDGFSPPDAAAAQQQPPPPAGDERDTPDGADEEGSAPDPEPGTPDDEDCDQDGADAVFAHLRGLRGAELPRPSVSVATQSEMD